jgi:ABC-type glycerol-3-phosphate transport system substrate-binding protein
MTMKKFALFLGVLLCGLTMVSAQEATPETTPAPLVITIWLPDALTRANDPTTLAVWNLQAQAFAEAENVMVDFRVKSSNGLGGIISTLQSASAVAPTVMPTLTLLSRRELLLAQQENLIVSLQRSVPANVVNPVGNMLMLGQVNNTLYGIPYLLEVLQVGFHTPSENNTSTANDTPIAWSYEAVLDRQQPLVLPLSTQTEYNAVLLAQYLASGGTIRTDGTLELNEDALLRVFEFYEAMHQANLLQTADIATFNTSLEDPQAQVVLSSTHFLRLNDPNIRAGALPTTDGETMTLLDGWSWAMVTTDSDLQRVATRFIAHMLEAENVQPIGIQLGMLPSQSDLLVDVAGASLAPFYESLLANARLSPFNPRSLTLERAIQDALTSILAGERTAQEATDYVAQQANG